MFTSGYYITAELRLKDPSTVGCMVGFLNPTKRMDLDTGWLF
ncbi:hypothetical protein [Kingella potus]|nr:hypothetical protein [Kingella potus]